MGCGMKKLLDVTDRKTRLLQQGLVAACGALGTFGFIALGEGLLPSPIAIAILVSGFVLLIITAGIKQRWEVGYRDHTIRFENSPVTAEKLYLDEGLVARGGLGIKMELRAPIRVGEGAGEEIVALVDAGLREFRLRLFVDNEEDDAPALAVPQTGGNVGEGISRVRESTVLGGVVLAKDIFEVIAAVTALISVLGASALWIF